MCKIKYKNICTVFKKITKIIITDYDYNQNDLQTKVNLLF